MKIPFDIKFRPQVESGEYKTETDSKEPVAIIKWDLRNDDGNIVCYYFDGKEEIPYVTGGKDLFLITPEPEPFTKLEKAVFDMLVERTNEATISEQQARKYAPIFLEIAKGEIYSHESLVEYAEKAKAEGKAEALKDLPRWRK